MSERTKVSAPIPQSASRMLASGPSRRGSSSPAGSTRSRPPESRQEGRQAYPDIQRDRQARHRGRAEKSVNAKVRYQWERHLGPAYSGSLLDRPVHEITALDVAAVLRPVWRSKPEVARKLYPAIRRVFDRARVILRDEHGIAMPDNPARWDDLKAMGFETPKGAHQGQSSIVALWADARIHRRAAGAKGDGRARPRNADPDQRSDERCPSSQMAGVRSRQGALECAAGEPEGPRAPEGVLRGPAVAQGCRDREGDGEGRVSVYVFPGQTKGPAAIQHGVPDAAQAHERMPKGEKPDADAKPRWHDPASGRPITAHGFRATFKTWAEEVATFPHAAIEHAMGHKVGGKVERAYTRTTLLDMRRKLMDASGCLLRAVKRRRKGHAAAEERLMAEQKRGDRPASRQASSSSFPVAQMSEWRRRTRWRTKQPRS